jgi:phosphatidyl-myo-inositol dimannoside synthase
VARLLLLTHEFAPFRGGIATETDSLASGGAALDHDVHVLAPDYHGDRAAEDARRPYRVHRFRGDFCSMLSFDGLTRFARRCREAMRRIEPTIVHAVDPQSQMALSALARFGLAKKYFFTVHGTELLRYRDEMMPRLWMSGALVRPRAIHAVSEATRSILIENFEVEPERTFVSHPAIADHWRSWPPADRNAVRSERDAGGGDRILVTVARRVREKGHLRIIDAIARIEPGLRDRIRYIIIGDGPRDYAESIEAAAREANIRVHLAGALDDTGTARVLDGADLFVMPSLRTSARLEGYGLAYIEAAARGVPALAADTGGAAEAVIDGATGVVLPVSADASAIAHALQELLSDPESLRRMGEAARHHAQPLTREAHARTVYDRFLAAGSG